MCDCRDVSMDVKTPRNVYLSAFYKRSFAYHSVKNRVPVILTQILDNLVRNKEEIFKEYGEGASDDLKKVIGEISKLKYEIQTNKPLANLTTDEWDVRLYNEYISKRATEEGHTTYFNTIWLLSECYMYRRIKHIFTLTDTLKDFDYFQSSKREAYEKSLPLMSSLAEYLLEYKADKGDQKKEFISLLKVNLWGNKFDLSVSLGKVDGPGLLSNSEVLESNILCDQSDKIWEAISLQSEGDPIIDIVLDNSGYEVFTDCCMADYIIEQNLAKKIRFYVKSIPWFISDVMEHDLHWMINELKQSADIHLNTMGERWEGNLVDRDLKISDTLRLRLLKEIIAFIPHIDLTIYQFKFSLKAKPKKCVCRTISAVIGYVNKKTWEIVVNSFWTLPFEFKFMKTLEPDLYKKLSEAKLIFFKGDLNYRKLFGEVNWDPTTSVEEALQGFNPSKLAILRTVKAHIVVGLAPGVVEECEKKDEKWNERGDYGLIQFQDNSVKI